MRKYIWCRYHMWKHVPAVHVKHDVSWKTCATKLLTPARVAIVVLKVLYMQHSNNGILADHWNLRHSWGSEERLLPDLNRTSLAGMSTCLIEYAKKNQLIHRESWSFARTCPTSLLRRWSLWELCLDLALSGGALGSAAGGSSKYSKKSRTP